MFIRPDTVKTDLQTWNDNLLMREFLNFLVNPIGVEVQEGVNS